MGLSVFRLVGIALSLLLLSVGKAADAPCREVFETAESCFEGNEAACGVCAVDFATINAAPGGPTCSEVDDVCRVKSCCPACASEVQAIGDCITGGLDCANADCSNVPPSPPSEGMPSPPSPAGGMTVPTPAPGNSSIPTECIPQLAANTLCFATTGAGCVVTCEEVEDTPEDLGCDSVEDFCEDFLECCPQCETETKALVSCLASSYGCDKDCDSDNPSGASFVLNFLSTILVSVSVSIFLSLNA